MGNNCIGKNVEDNVCRNSNGTALIQPYPNSSNRKIFEESFNSRRFTQEPATSEQRRCESVKSRPNPYYADNFSLATENFTSHTEQQASASSITQQYSSKYRRQSEYIPSSCCTQSPKKRVSKIFNNSISQTPSSSRRQISPENNNMNINTNRCNQTLNINFNQVPDHIQKAEWSLSPEISPKSKFFATNAVVMKKSLDGIQCDMSEVINFDEEKNSEVKDIKSNKSSVSTNVFEMEFQQNPELEQFFKDLHHKQNPKKSNCAMKITEQTLEDEDDSNSNKKHKQVFQKSIIQEQKSITQSDSSICNISSLTHEQMMVVKNKYNQSESNYYDKSTQLYDNQNYSYTQQKIQLSKDQVFSPQQISSTRASDNILSEIIKRNSDTKNLKDLIIA